MTLLIILLEDTKKVKMHSCLSGKSCTLHTVVPHIHIVSDSFLNMEIVANSNNCRNISIFYLINRIFAAEIIQEWKLQKEIR